MPLDTVATTGGPLTTDAVGQLVELDATYVAGDSVILVDRLVESERGCWVVAHAVVSGGATGDGASIAVALGWAADEDAAAAAIAEFEASIPSVASPISGRYLSSESPQQSDFESGKRTALSVAQGINLWADAPDGVYGGYVVLDAAPAGLETIPTPPPNREVSLNLLNVFYAVEWVIFAGFAVFLWWRLVRDEWEKEHGVGDASRPGRSPARANNRLGTCGWRMFRGSAPRSRCSRSISAAVTGTFLLLLVVMMVLRYGMGVDIELGGPVACSH